MFRLSGIFAACKVRTLPAVCNGVFTEIVGKKKSGGVSSARSYSTHAWTPHKASIFKVSDYLANRSLSLPSNIHFTITNPAYVTRGLDELRDIYAVIGTADYMNVDYRTANQLVVLTPERLAKHYIAAMVATEIKTESISDFVDVCNKLNKSIQRHINERKQKHVVLEQTSEERAAALIEKHKHNNTSDDPVIQHYLDMRRKMLLSLANTPNLNVDINGVFKKVLGDDLLRMAYHDDVREIVASCIANEVQLHRLTQMNQHHQVGEIPILLPLAPANHRLTQFMAGGIATGKSTVAKQFAASFKQSHGITFSDFAKISLDTFRLLLLDDPSVSDDVALRGYLTQEEARMMVSLSLELIEEKIKEEGYAPHVFMEAIYPTDNDLSVGVANGGKVRVAMTCYPPDAAVVGNYARFVDRQEQFPSSREVLSSQQLASSKTVSFIKANRGKDIVMTLHNTYKMIHEAGNDNTLIAIFHCMNNQLVILDLHGMLDYVKKSHINTSAICKYSIFSCPSKVSVFGCVDTFLEDYGQHEIVFVDPGAEIDNVNAYNEHAYAMYTPHEGLVVNNLEAFLKLVTNDKSLDEAFTAISTKGATIAQKNATEPGPVSSKKR